MSATDFTASRFHDGDQYRCVLARPARKHLHITYIDDSGIVHACRPIEEAGRLQPLPHPDGRISSGYPLQRLVKRFAAIGRARGITESAKAELSSARAE